MKKKSNEKNEATKFAKNLVKKTNRRPSLPTSPSEAIYEEILKFFPNLEISEEKFKKLSLRILRSLSKLSTNGEHSDLFGRNFDEFFSIYVSSMNMCAEMKELLDEHGITF